MNFLYQKLGRSILAACVLASTANGALAQKNNNAQGHWNFGGYFAHHEIDSDVAMNEGIDSSAGGLGGLAEFQNAHIQLSLGLEFISYNDNSEFSEEVIVDSFVRSNSTETADSDASAILAFVAIGPSFKLDNFDLAVQGGVSGVLTSERSINYCSNCREEDIDVRGGLFARFSATYSWKRVKAGLAYSHYADGDRGLENALHLTITTAY